MKFVSSDNLTRFWEKVKTFLSNNYLGKTANATTATKLATAVNINIKDDSGSHSGISTSFDGSSNISIRLPTTITANIIGSSSSCTGNAATASSCTGNASTAGSASYASTAGSATTAETADNAKWFGTCSTAASTNAKTVSISGFTLVIGARVTVKFSNAHTTTATKSTNTVSSNYPTLNVNSTGAKPITIGGQYAGEYFVNAGDVHEFVYDGTNWVDLTSTVIYRGGDSSNGYYIKYRDGKIEQWGSSTSTSVTLTIPFSNTYYKVLSSAINDRNTARYDSEYYRVSTKQIIVKTKTYETSYFCSGY